MIRQQQLSSRANNKKAEINVGFQHQAQAEMWGSSAQIDRTARTYTGSSIIAHAAQTRICPHTHSSGPLKLDARLLLYTVAVTKYRVFTAVEQNS